MAQTQRFPRRRMGSREYKPTYNQPREQAPLYLHMAYEKENPIEALEDLLNPKEIGGTGIGVTESMKIAICTDETILKNRLRKVTSSIMFSSGGVPSQGGLFDPEIFGITPTERQRTYGYIDLGRKFFHPYIYEVMRALGGKTFERIASGTTCGYIDENGTLMAITDMEDPRYDEDNTGIPWLVDNYQKIVWKVTGANQRNERIRLMSDLKPEQVCISKWVVLPIFYRDKEEINGRPAVHEISKMYNKLIQLSSNTDDLFASYNNALYFKIQMLLVDTRLLGQSLIEKKNGHYHKAVLGKSIDYGARDVISVAVMNEVQHPRDNQIDIFHTGVPLAKCLVLGYPLISRWVTNFLEDNLKNKNEVLVWEKGNYHQVDVKNLKDHSLIYDKKAIDKKMKRFINTFGSRFEPVKIYFQDGSTGNFFYTGFLGSKDPNDPTGATIFRRPMTWTDIFYMAAMECCSDKYVYATRYPVLTYSGTFPAQVAVMSTVETMTAIIDGRVYTHYPVVDVTLPSDQVATKFIDTLTVSNLYLSALGGDYDGDTMSSKMVYSIEANQEAEGICYSVKNFLNAQGKLMRDVGNEAYLTFYNMTRKE